jgi:transcriptional regulator with XRE-family HTH domain
MSTAVARILDELRSEGGLQGKDIANIVDVSPATVSRWTKNSATPTLSMQTILNDLRYVVNRLSEYYTSDEARLWLNSRHPLLNNDRAIDLIRSRRTEEVLAVIERLGAGVYL